VLCKGVEVRLPDGISFRDKDGIERKDVRIKWWVEQPTTLRSAALMPLEDANRLPDVPVSSEIRIGAYSGPPVFFGHYWLKSRPALMTPKVACVDYSAGSGGDLVAYRWQGEEELRAAHFVWV
jgi:hypothetical protein